MLNENPQLSGKRRNEEKRRRKRVGESSIFVTDPVGEKKTKRDHEDSSFDLHVL